MAGACCDWSNTRPEIQPLLSYMERSGMLQQGVSCMYISNRVFLRWLALCVSVFLTVVLVLPFSNPPVCFLVSIQFRTRLIS